jgi:hypothetical protein
MELTTKSVLQVLRDLTNEHPSQDLKKRVESVDTLFFYSSPAFYPFSILPNFLQRSIYSKSFHSTFHSFAFRVLNWKNMILFSQLLIGNLTPVKRLPEVSMSARLQIQDEHLHA